MFMREFILKRHFIAAAAILSLVFCGGLSANTLTIDQVLSIGGDTSPLGSQTLSNMPQNTFGLPPSMMVGVDLELIRPDTVVVTGIYPLWQQPGNMLNFTFTGSSGAIFNYSLGNSLGMHDLNMQIIQLPGVFNTQPLQSVTLTSSWANAYERSLVYGSLNGFDNPEPSTVALFLSGTAALLLLHRRRAKTRARG